MATVNKRVFNPVATTINSVACGGTATVNLQSGYENVMKSGPDGLQVPVVDRECQFVRGTVVIDDWPEAINLLTGAVGTLVFYERKSGTAAATGYIKHTITNPVIHSISLQITKGGYARLTFSFEVRFSSEAATIDDMWNIEDSQAAPSYVSSARGGWRFTTATHGTGGSLINIYHIMSFGFNISLRLMKACNDLDIGYTAVDAVPEAGLIVGGSLSLQDSEIDSTLNKLNKLILASADDLVLTCLQSGGAANKVITVANTLLSAGNSNSSQGPFTEYGLNIDVANDPDTPLTLSGANKIITIADAA